MRLNHILYLVLFGVIALHVVSIITAVQIGDVQSMMKEQVEKTITSIDKITRSTPWLIQKRNLLTKKKKF
jgi:hypothetical protein